ncbi:prenyltransferase/squalene oxidase repeat-containing protein [Urbifossiella limnaea]|uniref:Prenyltransferase and squalene oxidase repeat protein n=1 Tax=Urbifossiella limnaea TaxID=2528023 RepID=A0A517XZA8_9BACT|nr:prenyltransferase/squalene oxidase repeat-containing protein [Urbifossiella limnaea]QDU22841.1 Prenyltransferase and squalene oxidase repeat protein [Urbifossiella limnaea]
MSRLIRPLRAAAAVGLAATFALNLVPATGQPPAAVPTAPPPSEKAAEKLSPVKVTNVKVEMKTAVTPRPLSDSVKKGLTWLVKSQQEDGGWNQGGGWRNQGPNGGRVEGKTVEDPSDVGNTCFALLALFRAGHTATTGDYKDAVAKGLRFVLGRVERAEGDSLYITDVRGTQLQGKIGPYVDTFLVNLVLAEMRGSAGPDEERLVAALTKTMNKIVRHQGADGGFANQGGWAPTLSMGLCNKSVARARQNGVEVDRRVLERALADAKTAAEGKALASGPAPAAVAALPAGKAKAGDPGAYAAPPGASAEGAFSGRSAGFAGAGGVGGGDAGVKLYSFGRGAGNTQDAVNGLRVDGAKAKEVLKDLKATDKQKEEARETVKRLGEAERANDKVQGQLAATVRDEKFVAGFGSNGGEEFLSFMHISESLVLKGGKDWTDWDTKMRTGLEKAQDGSGSWSGHHCITGRTFCTSAALLVMTADRTPFPVDVLRAQAEKRDAKE